MDSKREKILKDLSTTLMDRTTKAAEEMASMCKLVDIPQHEFDAAAGAIYLYMFMGLTMDNKPTMTPDEMGFIVKGQYEFFRKTMKDG